MKILYIGDDQIGTTSLHRAEALRRLGHDVVLVNASMPIPRQRWAISLAVRTGFRVFEPWIRSHVLRRIRGQHFDLVWLNCSPEVGPGLARTLRRQSRWIAGYMNDDPFGGRDGRKWDLFKKALPCYDLLAVVRTPNIEEAYRAGAKKVVHAFMSCDPVAHSPVVMTAPERREWSSEVVFVGNWFPERGPFMARLLELGVPVTIRGLEWQRAPELGRFQDAWKGPAANGADYVRAIQSAKVALGLLSKGNRDLHTTRSAEVPFIGGAVFCAERTSAHEMLYRDGEEAVFWSSPEECAARCKELLADEERRRRIAAAARNRVIAWGLTNDEVMAALLRVLAGEPADHLLVQSSG
ncbi:MAG: glycosyltransferase [Opitutaceae bacterium]|nr:glycosyltransferase [Opitutaceae bacterium]